MKAPFLNNLQARVAVVFLLASIVPLAVLGLFSVQTADRVIATIVTSQLENMAAEKQDLLERWISERRADVAVVAGAEPVRSLEAARITPYLKLVQGEYGVYRGFVVAGADGRTVFETAGPAGGRVAEQPWFREAMAGGAHVSNVTREPASQEAVFTIAEAIRGADGRPRGAVSATVNTRAIVARVLSVSLGETGECYLVDNTGTFLAHKESRRILSENIAQSGSFASIFDDTHRPIYTDYRGIPVLGASRPVAGTSWFVVVEQDYDEAFASSSRLARNLSIGIVLAVAGAVGLSWVLASYISAPIRRLSEAAEALSQGEFDRALAVGGRPRSDEIGALDRSFHHMAEQIRQQHQRLHDRIGLTEEELRKSEEKLKRTLEAAARSERLVSLGRLASGVAHEIRTPLASLKLFLQSIEDEWQHSPEHAEDYRMAMRQVRRIESTINHFLDFARPREPSLADVDFARLVDEALIVVRPRANQQEVEVASSIAPDLPPVEGDMRQLSETLVNLLVNALDVMPDGGRISITVARSATGPEDGRPGVRIDVADSGPGLRDCDRDRLFEPFFTTKAAGSGLGLAIVRATVERHGGTIQAQSRPDEGAVFSIFLPAMER